MSLTIVKRNLPILLLAVACLTIVGLFAWSMVGTPDAGKDDGYGRFDFYGLVVDERGNPLPGAVVTVQASVGSIGDLKGWHEEFTVTTDPRGRFTVKQHPGDGVSILEIKKPGYAWLIDYAGAGAVPERFQRYQNTGFSFHGIETYGPDPDRPAIFPLIREGSHATTQLSRGGTDRQRDGKFRVNEPWTPLIPSAGAGAITDPEEIGRRMRELFRQAATQPR